MSYTERLIEGYQKIIQGDWINALIQICINLDAVAKKKYGGKPGARIKRYVRENQYILLRVAMLHLEIQGDFIFQVAGGKEMKFEEVIYELVRCTLLHEGELDSRIKIVQSASIGLDNEGTFLLSIQMIMALFLLLVSDPQNIKIQWPSMASATVEGRTIRFSDVQGDPQKLVAIFRAISKEQSNKK